ncbi:fumarylacetoacetase [Polaromonas sp. JS666]|uniref:fumarylacetoacetase n=1 Tax=Polaromonas sp. (strain JS666 / ATCC BAA-500) TaxID=296591 RepID=UPI0000463F26|nr:fumarylacetoacetase [Polaromonas sp. JS666]ABE44910.1 fumarylacetoacetate hydrolase [Polaromonas sp. JS666]
MNDSLNATHDPALRSWVTSANAADTDFPIQNLPFGRFRRVGSAEAFRIGVAIGDQALDLKAAGLIATDDMNVLMAMGAAERQALRAAISEGLREGSPSQSAWLSALLPQAGLEMTLPCRIGDYTDFYTGIHHATTVGKLFRPDAPLLPNYKWVPIGYHGRASSIGVSGQSFPRPLGQTKGPNEEVPVLRPSHRMDYELELGVFMGQGNAPGDRLTMDQAEAHAFGMVLLNDWSARDVQAWEYQPLGPFLAKNFASTISPWIVTMEALAPFRAPFVRPEGDPQPLPYLDSAGNRQQGGIDVELEVWLQTLAMRDAGQGPVRLSQSSFRDAYWTVAQMITHHTVNGCNLQPGDLLGSGTLSGARPEQAGSLLELSSGGKNPLTLANGETRTFLEDGDSIILRGYCARAGFRRIGFGDCQGRLLPARS